MKQEISFRATFSSSRSTSFIEEPTGQLYPDKWKQLKIAIENTFRNPDKNAIEIILQINEKLINHWGKYYITNGEKNEFHKQKSFENFRKHAQFIREKIMLNISLGQQQGLYRKDLSKELIGRIYVKKVMDLYNSNDLSHHDPMIESNYYLLFKDFVLGICNNNGLRCFQVIYE